MELRFRGISEESGRFVYGSLLQSKANKVDGNCSSWIKPRDLLMLGALVTSTDRFTKVKTSTVGQFTGLQDKNGIDYYLGDIGEFSNGDKFYLAMEGWLEVYIEWIGQPECYHQGRDLYRIGNAKIIGNIHQHSHLLDKGE